MVIDSQLTLTPFFPSLVCTHLPLHQLIPPSSLTSEKVLDIRLLLGFWVPIRTCQLVAAESVGEARWGSFWRTWTQPSVSLNSHHISCCTALLSVMLNHTLVQCTCSMQACLMYFLNLSTFMLIKKICPPIVTVLPEDPHTPLSWGKRLIKQNLCPLMWCIRDYSMSKHSAAQTHIKS